MTTEELSESELAGAPAATVAEPPPRWSPLILVSLGTFITVLDFFIVNVAVPDIQQSLHASSVAVQFVLAGYGLPLATLMITSGRMGDLYGRRRLFVTGLALFTAASACAGLAQSPAQLVAARVFQGIAASLVTPQVLALLGAMYQGRARAVAFNVYGLAIGLAAVFGQLIGGSLIALDPGGLGWRAIFLVNVPVGLVAVALVPRLVPESRGGGRTRLDVIGMLLVMLGLVAVVLPLTEGRELGWPLWSVLCLIAAVPVLAVFAVQQHRGTVRGGAPLVNTTLFRSRAFSVGLFAMMFYYATMGACFLVLSLYLQQGRGMSPLGSGLLYLPLGAGFFAATALAGRLVGRLGRQAPAVGALLVVVGYGTLAVLVSGIGVGGRVEWLAGPLLVAGLGMGLTMAPLSSMVLAPITADHAAAASGVLTTAQEIGATVGTALIGSIFFRMVGDHTQAPATSHAFSVCLAVLVAFDLLVVVLVQLMGKASEPASD
ncbi:MFS transporter [Streptomyces avermitilis]|nr:MULTISPECIES: MFS transporter [Streptomyces]OOV24990.1 MFS transporter [Streptomyces avermitilis]BBJ55519.1 MFS transporter [Streptomyces avermitilis]GDY67478.1 MFS transporter [Streptomyces avermitilis]GDY72228.1 MFS transporter [Streptomyces avermitilis]GDY81374.1 MFS transporter [Streptomyces avermitilis]